MKKESLILNKKIVVGYEFLLMLISIFAFAFILSEVGFVNGDGEDVILPDGTPVIQNGESVFGLSDSQPSKTLTGGSPEVKITKQGSSPLSKFFGVKEVGGTADALLTGLQWGIVAYGIGQLVGGLLGLESQNVDALSTSLAAGAFVYTGLE